jgi:hypothetical protein
VAEPRDTLKLFAIPRLMFLVLVIFGGWYATRLRNHDARGTVIVDGTPFPIEACKKVPVPGPDSIGADLRGPDGNLLRVVRDDQGAQLWFYPKGAAVAVPVDRRDCSQWEINLYAQTSDPLTPSSGDAAFTCLVGGHKIDGAVSFDQCGS